MKRYGTEDTYLLTVPWLCARDDEDQYRWVLEDWGPGNENAKEYRPVVFAHDDWDYAAQYHPIGGKGGVDLAEYTSQADAILIRHVLEGNLTWEKILTNAVASFRKRMCLVTYTPLSDHTHQWMTEPETGKPILRFSKADLMRPMGNHLFGFTEIVTDHYESIFYLEKR